MSNDNRALSVKSLHEIEEIDAAGTIALTDYVIVSDGNIPKKIKISVLLALLAPEISFLDLSDTPSAYSDGDTVKSTASAIVLTTV